MDKRQEERLALEGNSVFQDLRMQRDALLEALEWMVKDLDECARLAGIEEAERRVYQSFAKQARAAIAQAKGQA